MTIGLTSGYRSAINLHYPNNPKYKNDFSRFKETDDTSELKNYLYRMTEADFFAYGPNKRKLEERAEQFYSNGRPRFDRNGNELYANGSRKIADDGRKLYSNGQPKFDLLGNAIHSNGRRKFSNDMRPLYANGRPMVTETGKELFRNGKPKWSGDGQEPGAYQRAHNHNFDEQKFERGNSDVGTANTPQNSDLNFGDPDADPLPGNKVEHVKRSVNRLLYANGRERETASGVDLHYNGRKRYTGDGMGANPYQRGGFQDQKKADFVQELYSNARPAYVASGMRLYSDGKQRSSINGEFLYPNGHRLVNNTTRAITPTGEAVNATYGFQGRAQGVFPLFTTGTIVAQTGDKLTIKGPRGTSKRPSCRSARRRSPAKAEPIPGDNVGQLAAKLGIQAIVRSNFNTSRRRTGRIEQGPATDRRPRDQSESGLQEDPDGRQTVITVLQGQAEDHRRGQTPILNSPAAKSRRSRFRRHPVQRISKGVVTPAPFQSVDMGRKAELIVTQDIIYKDGKVVRRLEPHALAIIEK
ncbi:MAG: hypothetical protein U1D30_14775 [Planctomycetota bacterium]